MLTYTKFVWEVSNFMMSVDLFEVMASLRNNDSDTYDNIKNELIFVLYLSCKFHE